MFHQLFDDWIMADDWLELKGYLDYCIKKRKISVD